MGIQLAAFFYAIGYAVTVWNRGFPEAKQKRLSFEKRKIEKAFNCAQERHGIVFLDQIEQLPATITIDALAEDIEVKKSVIKQLPFEPAPLGLFTNSSSYSPSEVAIGAHGLHFFNPIYSVALVETTCAVDSLPLLKDIKEAGLQVIHTKGNRGYIANYILFQEISAALSLVENFGYDTDTVDNVLAALGRQTSIFDVVDFVGVDITKTILDNLHKTNASIVAPQILTTALASGIFGRKNRTSIRSALDSKVRNHDE